jgi:hypothetical protein
MYGVSTPPTKPTSNTGAIAGSANEYRVGAGEARGVDDVTVEADDLVGLLIARVRDLVDVVLRVVDDLREPAEADGARAGPPARARVLVLRRVLL